MRSSVISFEGLKVREKYLDELTREFPFDSVVKESERAVKVMELEEIFKEFQLIIHFFLRFDNELHGQAAEMPSEKAKKFLDEWYSYLYRSMTEFLYILDLIEKSSKRLKANLYREPVITPEATRQCRQEIQRVMRSLSEVLPHVQNNHQE